MKKLKILFPFLLLIFLFASCTEGSRVNEAFNVQEQMELMQQDPVVIDYFEAMAKSYKILGEDLGVVGHQKYRGLLKEENANNCNVNFEVFEENESFKKFAKAKCLTSKLKEKFKAKYPDFSKMKRSDRRAIIRAVTLPSNYDMEKMGKRAEEYDKAFSDEEKNRHKEEVKRKVDVEIPEYNSNNN